MFLREEGMGASGAVSGDHSHRHSGQRGPGDYYGNYDPGEAGTGGGLLPRIHGMGRFYRGDGGTDPVLPGVGAYLGLSDERRRREAA